MAPSTHPHRHRHHVRDVRACPELTLPMVTTPHPRAERLRASWLLTSQRCMLHPKRIKAVIFTKRRTSRDGLRKRHKGARTFGMVAWLLSHASFSHLPDVLTTVLLISDLESWTQPSQVRLLKALWFHLGRHLELFICDGTEVHA